MVRGVYCRQFPSSSSTPNAQAPSACREKQDGWAALGWGRMDAQGRDHSPELSPGLGHTGFDCPGTERRPRAVPESVARGLWPPWAPARPKPDSHRPCATPRHRESFALLSDTDLHRNCKRLKPLKQLLLNLAETGQQVEKVRAKAGTARQLR